MTNRTWINIGLWVGGYTSGYIVFHILSSDELTTTLVAIGLCVIGGLLSAVFS